MGLISFQNILFLNLFLTVKSYIFTSLFFLIFAPCWYLFLIKIIKKDKRCFFQYFFRFLESSKNILKNVFKKIKKILISYSFLISYGSNKYIFFRIFIIYFRIFYLTKFKKILIELKLEIRYIKIKTLHLNSSFHSL